MLSISDNWQFHYRTDTRLHIYKRVEHTYLMLERFYIVEIVSGQERKRERGSEPEKKGDLFSIALKVQIPFKQRHWFSNALQLCLLLCDFGPRLLVLLGNLVQQPIHNSCFTLLLSFTINGKTIEESSSEAATKRSTCVYLYCKISAFCVLARLAR